MLMIKWVKMLMIKWANMFMIILIITGDENGLSFSIRKIYLVNPEWSQTDFYITYCKLIFTKCQ